MTFDVQAGEVVTLLGRNGAGKTTTMRAIMGLLGQRARARSCYEGRELIRLKSNRIARLGIAYCPEERGIFASLDVRREPDAAARWCKPGGLAARRDLHAVSQPQGARRPARAPGCRAASSRCWRSPASCAPAPSCCCSTSRPRAWPRSSCSRSAVPSACCSEQGFTILLVEQNFRFAATVADRHYVVEHGQVIDMIPNCELEANRDKLQDYLGV